MALVPMMVMMRQQSPRPLIPVSFRKRIATFADPQVKAIVKQYRDRVPHAVFLIDMMMRDDLPSLLSRRGGFDETTSHRIIQAGEVLQRVHAVTNHPLKEVIDAAVRALNLDIDTIAGAFASAVGRRTGRHLYAGNRRRRESDFTWIHVMG